MPPSLPTFIRTALAFVLLQFGPGLALAEEARVTLLLTNDVYRMSEENGRGGLARLAAVVKAERAKGGTVLFAHAGDTLSPCLLCGFDQGAHMIALFNEIPPDVFVPGNHEFDFGKDAYLKRRAEARFPFLAANMRGPDGQPLPGHQDRAIVEAGAVRIGLVGLAHERTAALSNAGDLSFTPTLETLRSEAKALRDEGADLVVAVAHAERATDFAILDERLADVVLTGHDHDLRIVHDGRSVMAESGEDAAFVVAIDLALSVAADGGGRRVSWRPTFRIIDTAAVTPDPEVAAKVTVYEAALSRELDVPLATTQVELDSREPIVRSRESALTNLVADAVRDATQADVAILNAGGFRGNRIYPAGTTLTRRDIVTELPFGNDTALVELSGGDLKAALENGFAQMERPSGRFPQVSGLRIEVDPARPAGSRIVSVTVAGAPLDERRSYRVATNNYMLRGGDGYAALGKGRVLIGGTDGKPLAGETMAYLQKRGTIASRPEGRIVLK